MYFFFFVTQIERLRDEHLMPRLQEQPLEEPVIIPIQSQPEPEPSPIIKQEPVEQDDSESDNEPPPVEDSESEPEDRGRMQSTMRPVESAAIIQAQSQSSQSSDGSDGEGGFGIMMRDSMSDDSRSQSQSFVGPAPEDTDRQRTGFSGLTIGVILNVSFLFA